MPKKELIQQEVIIIEDLGVKIDIIRDQKGGVPKRDRLTPEEIGFLLNLNETDAARLELTYPVTVRTLKKDGLITNQQKKVFAQQQEIEGEEAVEEKLATPIELVENNSAGEKDERPEEPATEESGVNQPAEQLVEVNNEQTLQNQLGDLHSQLKTLQEEYQDTKKMLDAGSHKEDRDYAERTILPKNKKKQEKIEQKIAEIQEKLGIAGEVPVEENKQIKTDLEKPNTKQTERQINQTEKDKPIKQIIAVMDKIESVLKNSLAHEDEYRDVVERYNDLFNKFKRGGDDLATTLKDFEQIYDECVELAGKTQEILQKRIQDELGTTLIDINEFRYTIDIQGIDPNLTIPASYDFNAIKRVYDRVQEIIKVAGDKLSCTGGSIECRTSEEDIRFGSNVFTINGVRYGSVDIDKDNKITYCTSMALVGKDLLELLAEESQQTEDEEKLKNLRQKISKLSTEEIKKLLGL